LERRTPARLFLLFQYRAAMEAGVPAGINSRCNSFRSLALLKGHFLSTRHNLAFTGLFSM